VTDTPEPTRPGALAAAVEEIEAHLAEGGWDQPARLYALVPTAELVASSPDLADALGVTGSPEPGALTAVEQEQLAPDTSLEDLLPTILWPDQVTGCAAVVERLVLPPSADDDLPEDPAEAASYASEHPERQEVRIVAAALRGGETFAALRMRSHDDDRSVVTGPHLVPQLTDLLLHTLTEEADDE
jgi:hypothetical protein